MEKKALVFRPKEGISWEAENVVVFLPPGVKTKIVSGEEGEEIVCYLFLPEHEEEVIRSLRYLGWLRRKD